MTSRTWLRIFGPNRSLVRIPFKGGSTNYVPYSDTLVDGQDTQHGCSKNAKLRLSSIIDDLEAFARARPPATHEIERKNQPNAQLAGII
jgi:hypothetical protein